MKSVGIIVEYNPLHNGHIYQINKVKEMFPGYVIIVAMSPNFTMRGEISLLNKWQKTELALNHGVDIVVEIPTWYSIQSADTFAYAGVNLLHEVGIDTLVFGSESEDEALLEKIARVQIDNAEFDMVVQEYMRKGDNYPTALSKGIYKLTGLEVNKPNDILAVSYIKEIFKLGTGIKFKAIKRTNDFHDVDLESDVVSASNIRNKYLSNKDFSSSVPNDTLKYLKGNVFDFDLLFNLIKYKIICEKDHLKDYHFVTEGIERRLYNAVTQSENMEELITNIKSKRYTYNRINRILLHLLLGFKKGDVSLEYVRVLGLSDKGRSYLKSIRNSSKLPIITSFSSKYSMMQEEIRVSQIYSMISKNESLVTYEYKKHAIIKEASE